MQASEQLTLQRQLLAALAGGEMRRVQELVSSGADVNCQVPGPGGETPLIRSIASGDLVLVQLLIGLEADVNLPAQGPSSWTPLMFAHDHPDIIRVLLAAGAHANARSAAGTGQSSARTPGSRPGGETALHLAAAVANAESVRALLKGGAEVEAIADNGLAPLDYAIRLGSMNEAALALVEAGAKLTPGRLEAMHSAAHNPDSDLVEFPVIEPAHRQATAVEHPGFTKDLASENRPAEPRCPQCHALLYSRKARVCGNCGTPLPPELVLTDSQAQAQAQQRQWAQDLADKFGPPDPTRRGATHMRTSETPAATTSPEELLRRISCAGEFRNRPRPAFWLYVIGYGFPLFVAAFLTLYVRLLPPPVLLVGVGLFFLACWRAWAKASPICPNCRQNIRLCPASYCHVCGQSLRRGRCTTCGVEETWTNIFRPYRGGGNFRWITYCPACGALLEAKVRRGLEGD